MSLRLRPAVAGDLVDVTALYAQEVKEGVASYEYAAPDEAKMTRRWRELVAAGYPYLIAELDGCFGGYAYASSYRSREGYRWTVEDTVYVSTQLHGRGIGRALLARLIDDCEVLGFRQMIAVIGDRGNAPSMALHQRLGFTTVGVFRGIGSKHGRWLDGVQMQRSLDAGADAPPDT